MTNEMKNDIVQDYCMRQEYNGESCVGCKIEKPCENCFGDFLHDAISLDEAYEILMKQLDTEEDVINHPSHYNREGAMESIEEMELIFGKEAVKHFCLCNVWKYRYRAADKNGAEDLNKSDWYMRKYKELCSNG